MAREIKYDDEAKQKAHDAVDLDAMERELNLTQEAAEKLQVPIVWSHNDLLSGNVLVTHQVCPFRTRYACLHGVSLETPKPLIGPREALLTST